MLTREVVDEDLKRLRQYAALVKVVENKFKPWLDFRAHPFVWNYLIKHIGPQDFPLLQEVHVDQEVLIQFFLGKHAISPLRFTF